MNADELLHIKKHASNYILAPNFQFYYAKMNVGFQTAPTQTLSNHSIVSTAFPLKAVPLQAQSVKPPVKHYYSLVAQMCEISKTI